MMNTQQLLSASVTPIVLISACGLVMLALYNRLSAILARIRAFYQQKLELIEQRDHDNAVDRKALLLMVDSQIAVVTLKAKMIQHGLIYLLGACLAFLICSLLAEISLILPIFGGAAIAIHCIGMIAFASGIGWALRELVHSLSPLDEEAHFLKSLQEQHDAASANENRARLSNAA